MGGRSMKVFRRRLFCRMFDSEHSPGDLLYHSTCCGRIADIRAKLAVANVHSGYRALLSLWYVVHDSSGYMW